MTSKIDQSFDAMEWHDAVLLSLNIDRRQPGERDEVTAAVQWPNGRKQAVRFKDCYGLDAQMNFGVTTPESIRSGRCIHDSPKLLEVRHQWAKLGIALGDLHCFEIETNSTASKIRIYAKGFDVSDLEV